MESNDELKKDVKNRPCFYFDEKNKLEDFCFGL